MTTDRQSIRFGVWALVHGSRAALQDPDEPYDASWQRNRDLVLEAEALGCPLIYSDLPGYRDFAGPGALYCDLTRPDNLADLVMTAAAAPRPAPFQRDWKETEARLQFRALVDQMAAKVSAWSA